MRRLAIDWAWVKKELFRIEKIRPGSNRAVSSCAEECIRLAMKLAKPSAVRAIKKASAVDLKSHALRSHIRGAESIAFFLVTIGDAVEKRASVLMASGDALKGYLLDRIGSIAVESLAQEAEDALASEYAKKNMSVSMRFSPGYCDWAIEEQFKLAEILDFQKAGVKLNEKCMMVPKKSISAACAVGPKGLFSRKKSHCSLCAQEECVYRRD
jgi:hypothetical protein